MTIKFHIIIPARYHAKRLPGKLMLDIAGKTVLERVYFQALQAMPASIIIATDSDIILQHAGQFGAQVQLTAVTHRSGTDRIAEVVALGEYDDNDIIINVQGDEPFIDPKLIIQLVQVMANCDVPMATLCWPMMLTQPNVNMVKVVRDCFNNALYFSRAELPVRMIDGHKQILRHIGIYAYRVVFLRTIVQQPACSLEFVEDLEQLRVLWLGYKIRVEDACVSPSPDINTVQDVANAREFVTSFLKE